MPFKVPLSALTPYHLALALDSSTDLSPLTG